MPSRAETRANILLNSDRIGHRQRGLVLALENCETARNLVYISKRCTPDNPCNTSQCNHCGVLYPRNRPAIQRYDELRLHPKQENSTIHLEHPTVETADLAKRSRYTPIAIGRDFDRFWQLHRLNGVHPFTLNLTIIPFDHNALDVGLGENAKLTIQKEKRLLKQFFEKHMNGIDFIGRVELAIVKLDGNPLWEKQKKHAEVSSTYKYGILVHVHGLISGDNKDLFHEMRMKHGYDAANQLRVDPLHDYRIDSDGYCKGGASGYGQYSAKSYFNSSFGPDSAKIARQMAVTCQQVGKQVLNVRSSNLKLAPLIRTWECLHPEDTDAFEEMEQDYQEHMICPQRDLIDYAELWGVHPDDCIGNPFCECINLHTCNDQSFGTDTSSSETCSLSLGHDQSMTGGIISAYLFLTFWWYSLLAYCLYSNSNSALLKSRFLRGLSRINRKALQWISKIRLAFSTRRAFYPRE